MKAQFQPKTLVRLVLVVVVACVVSTLLVDPRADAASDGYGVSARPRQTETTSASSFALPGLR